MNRILFLMAGLLTAGAVSSAPVSVALEVKEAVVELAPGLKTAVWSYNGTVPGPPIVVSAGDLLTVTVKNSLAVPTSVHWHGVELPNDQDGMAAIAPGGVRTYRFTPVLPGTYWYHSHTAPVLEQLDRGLYGALIVKAPEDAKYSSDRTFVLDDWYLGPDGRRLAGTARGGMERLGNVETVNGKTGSAIVPLTVAAGELHKLRFINASTAAVHRLKLSSGRFRVTHTDGHPLTAPFATDTLVLQPGERLDAEFAADGAPGGAVIASEDRSLGLAIPIVTGPGRVPAVGSPFVAPASKAFPGISAKQPDATLVLNSRMDMAPGAADGGHHHSGSGGMMGMGMSMGTGSGMVWTINGQAFPQTEPLNFLVGQVVKLRLVNQDTGMGHPMDHPIHLHGTFFQIVAVNGRPPERETWKDTVAVPAGGSVDIAFRYVNPGDWMLHCHIIDHEDNGMVTMVRVR